ncbi:hypothetical protein PSHT_12635 [Puccinia striiformis]|uniref:HIT-type domain-containing protein n=1 Tax=Puccinia striiformis TaxID=27350 RepID=A0A2S4UVH9_9BASI|nr:hypothetical protein PSHT_12635 [Puccinia striiformis]
MNVQELLSLKPNKGRTRNRINQANQDTIKCLVCQINFAKYTCPNCNLRYCTVNCFKSQVKPQTTHLEKKKKTTDIFMPVSFSMFGNALLEDIQAEQSTTKDGRPTQSQLEILEILKKLESSGLSLSDEEEEEEDDESLDFTEEQLDCRYDNESPLTTDKLSKEELLRFLTAEQIQEFDRKVSNNELDSEFIEATINTQCHDPWWLTEEHLNSSSSSKINLIDQALLPTLPDRLNPHLFYHIFSVSLGYVAIIRYYGIKSLSEITLEDSQDLIPQLPKLFPILFDTHKVLKLESISDCFSHFIQQSNGQLLGPESIKFFIQDLSYLFPKKSPLPVFIHDISSNQSNTNKVELCAYALSDLYRYLNKIDGKDWRKIKISNHKPILKKLLFFISYSIDSKRLDKFNEEVQEEETHTVPINDDELNSDINHHPLSRFLLVKNDNTSQIEPAPKKKTPMIVETTEV